MPFHPEEVIFSPTARCNLACVHCNVAKGNAALSLRPAKKFLIDCRKSGISRVGFTGGEPFLAGDFLCKLTRFAVKEGLLFTRIITNGVWHKDSRDLTHNLDRLFKAGYDGSICVSVDAYHRQDLKKLARFIKAAQKVWRRPDMVSIACVTGSDRLTKKKLQRLAGLLKARLSGFGGTHPVIKSISIHSSRARFNVPYHIKIGKIDLSPIGKAGQLKNPWDGKWFKEDFCKGPGNVFFVEPDGSVKPCCGYASGLEIFNIGNIKKDSVSRMLKNIRQNRILYDIFNIGLSRIRRRFIKLGVKFPGKTSNHCFFCHYFLTQGA